MAQYLHGERIGRSGRLLLGCSATLFDASGSKILLTQREDNQRWCLPGGAVEVGESVSEACEREVWEETGLRVRVTRLLGVYSSPHMVIQYNDGNRFQLYSLNFAVELLAGTLRLSDETLAYGYFSQAEIAQLDIIDPHVERIRDAFAQPEQTVVR